MDEDRDTLAQLAAGLEAEQNAVLDRAQGERRNLTPDEERQYLALGRLRRVANQLAEFEAEDETRKAAQMEKWGRVLMTRDLRELHARLADAEECVRAALNAKDVDTAERLMEEVRDLRAQIKREEAKVEREHESAYLRMREMRMMAAEGAFAKAILDAGFNLRERPVVTVPLAQAFPPEETWRVRPPEGILPLGRDERWLFPLLPSRDLEGTTAIEDFRQTGRTVTGSIERDPAATTDKATVDVAVEHVVEKVRQFAVVIPDIPNQVFDSIATAEAFLNAEGRFAVEQAIDQHVMAQIMAAKSFRQ